MKDFFILCYHIALSVRACEIQALVSYVGHLKNNESKVRHRGSKLNISYSQCCLSKLIVNWSRFMELKTGNEKDILFFENFIQFILL